MAVGHETSTESHTGTTGSASEASFDISVPFTASSKGLLVYTFVNANANDATSVKIDPAGANTDVPAVSGGRAVDTVDEPGDCKAWFLGTGLPTTTKTVRINRTNNANVMYAVAITVTAAGATEVHTAGIVLLQENNALGEQNVTDGSPGTNSLRYVGINWGGSNIPAVGTSTTAIGATGQIDFGVRTAATARETTAGQGSRPVGYATITADDCAAVHLAVREVSAGTTVTPAVIPVVVALPTPTVLAAVTVTPAVIAVTVALPTPTVLIPALVTPTVVAATVTLPTPTVLAASTVAPAVVALVTALPTPTVLAGAVVTPAVFAVVTTLPTPTPVVATSTRLSNTFEGGSDGTAITTGNSGGTSGDAFDMVFLSGTGAVVFDDDAGVAAGTFAALASTTSAASANAYMQWAAAWQAETEVWVRFYFRTSDPTPATNHEIWRLENGAANTVNLQLRTTGVLGLRDNVPTLRYSSTTVLTADTDYRIEIHVVHSATVGHMEARLFFGANLHGTTPDETFGNLTDNWNLGAQSDEVFYGIVSTPGQAINHWFDELAIDDTAWIGPAVGDGSATVTPAVIAVTTALPAPTILAAATVTPAVVPLVATLPTPTTRIDVVVTPTVIAVTVSLSTPTVLAAATVTPAAMPVTVALPIPTILAAAKTTPAVIPVTVTLPTPTILAAVRVTPAVIPLVTTLPTPTVLAASRVTPAVIPLVTTFPTPTINVAGGATTVTPAVIAVIVALPTPAVLAASRVTPVVVPLTVTLPTPQPSIPAVCIPTTIAVAASLPTPTILAAVLVSPSTVAILIGVPNPVVLAGVTVTPAVIPIFVTFPGPTIALGAIPFWTRNPLIFTGSPVSHTKTPVGFVKVGPGDTPPWN